MDDLKKRLQELFSRLGFKKGNIARVITAIAIPVVFFLGYYFIGGYFFESIWITNGILLSVILLVVAIIAGFAVIKSLFLVAGELSLLIFLSQSYCAVPERAPSGDSALKSLLILGLLYIAVTFVGSLITIAKENYMKVKSERWSIARILAVALFTILAGSFIREVYLVVQPIITSLCVYK